MKNAHPGTWRMALSERRFLKMSKWRKTAEIVAKFGSVHNGGKGRRTGAARAQAWPIASASDTFGLLRDLCGGSPP